MTANHGGSDALGSPQWDYSSNANSVGPCPTALLAVNQADVQHYPDPSYRALRNSLAAFHAVDVERVIIAASGSEFIGRITAAVARLDGTTVWLPELFYNDYLHAANLWGLQRVAEPNQANLLWLCEPTSPLGTAEAMATTFAKQRDPLGLGGADGTGGAGAGDARVDVGVASGGRVDAMNNAGRCDVETGLSGESLGGPVGRLTDVADVAEGGGEGRVVVLDRAYEPLRLSGQPSFVDAAADELWQLWTPNKALGLTGVRGAYAIAPSQGTVLPRLLEQLAPSWILGAHGVAMLEAWTTAETQDWLEQSRKLLTIWKETQIAMLQDLGWECLASEANYFCARPPRTLNHLHVSALRSHGIKLRETDSFGLPGYWRLSVQPPEAQDVLRRAHQEVL